MTAEVLTPEGREEARLLLLAEPRASRHETNEEQATRVHRRLNQMQTEAARRLGRYVATGTSVEGLLCPWCGTPVAWACGHDRGRADCQDGTMVSRRFSERPCCFWPGANIRRLGDERITVVRDLALDDKTMMPQPVVI